MALVKLPVPQSEVFRRPPATITGDNCDLMRELSHLCPPTPLKPVFRSKSRCNKTGKLFQFSHNQMNG